MENYQPQKALPPRHVYSAVISNRSGVTISVHAVYQTPPDGHAEHFQDSVPADGTLTIPQKLVESGTMTMTGHIQQVTVTASDGRTAELQAPMGVTAPKKNWPLHVVVRDDSTLDIRQPDCETDA